MEPEAIRIERAAVERGGGVVWSDVDVHIERGEFVAVLGPNGSGKSTLLEVVLGLLRLRSGRATVLDSPPGQASSRIGYLPQRNSLDGVPRIRGKHVVRLGLDGGRWGLPMPKALSESARSAERRVDEVIELVGATGYAERPIGELSGGEQQRLMIAQALSRQPEILLLDEPLDNLDLSNQRAVAALVQRICKAEGASVLLVAHDVNPILTYIDRVIYFAQGRGVEGRPRDVITSETLTDLYGVPIEVLESSDGRLVVVGTPEAPAIHSPRHAH